MNTRRLVRGLMVGSALTALAMAGATPAAAHDLAAQAGGGLVAQDRAAETGLPSLLAALQRDLGLSRAEAEQLVDAQPDAMELEQELAAELGADFAGSWFDVETSTLTVGVTDPDAAPLAATSGAEVAVVAHSQPELAAIVAELDALAEADPQALAGATSWGIDTPANQVVLTVPAGQAGEFDQLVAGYGDAVRVEESAFAASPTNHPFLDAGIPYSSPSSNCSTGFNAENPNTGTTFFLTAGHCHSVFGNSSSDGITIGPAVGRRISSRDDALVRNDNPGEWIQGPWVWQYPGIITVRGQTDPGVGTAVCKSGRTTAVTCGTVTALDVTVNLTDGRTLTGMTQHSACTERGDSGGPAYTATGRLAAGISVASRLRDGRCLEVSGDNNVGWFQPLNITLPSYQAVAGGSLVLMTG